MTATREPHNDCHPVGRGHTYMYRHDTHSGSYYTGFLTAWAAEAPGVYSILKGAA